MLDTVRGEPFEERPSFFSASINITYLVETVIPTWLGGTETTFKAWCLSCGLGEDVYTLGAVLKTHLPPDRSFRILATDQDPVAIDYAINGVYPIARWQEIAEPYQNLFVRGTDEVSNWFRAERGLRDAVTFKMHHLDEACYPGQDMFDLVVGKAPLRGRPFEKVNLSAKLGTPLFIGDKILRARNEFDL